MVFELHVWGSGFSLPSADAECLAAICHLSHVTFQDTTRRPWLVIASYDPSNNPSERLPLLHDTETLDVISGFSNIVTYIQSRQFSVDGDAVISENSLEAADLIAFSSFVSSRAALLLDLSLFVSSENYSNLTRPTYSQLYPWPLQYFVLPNLRHAAKARTAHLGFSSLDLDVEQEGDSGGQDRNSQYKSLIPESLRSAVGREPTVTGFLKAQRASSQFGLEALVAELCDPLVELLGSQQYLFSSRLPPSQDGSDVGPTSLDCLVAGYFALMLNADVPSSWLRDGIKRRYPSLVSYIDTLTGCFQDTHDSTKANSGSKLPWADAPTSKLNRSSIWEQIATSVLPPLPFISSSVQTRPTQLSTPKSHHLETPNDAVSPPDSSISRRTAIMATTTVLGLGLGLGLAMATSNTSFFPNHILPTYNHTFFTSFLPFMSSSSSSAAAANDDNNNGNGAGHYFPSSSQNRGSNSNNTSTNSNNSNRKTRFEDYGEAGALLSSAIGGSAGVENPRI